MLTIILGALLAVTVGALLLRRRTPSGSFFNDAARPEGVITAADNEWLQKVLRKKIVVHLKNDQSIEGVLMKQTQDGVILRAAVLLGDDGKRTSMAGETFTPRENIAFAQLDE